MVQILEISKDPLMMEISIMVFGILLCNGFRSDDGDDDVDDDDDVDCDPDYSLSRKPRMGHFCIELKDKVDAFSKP